MQVGKHLILHLLLSHFAPLTPVSREGPFQVLFGSYWLFQNHMEVFCLTSEATSLNLKGDFMPHSMASQWENKIFDHFLLVLWLYFELGCISSVFLLLRNDEYPFKPTQCCLQMNLKRNKNCTGPAGFSSSLEKCIFQGTKSKRNLSNLIFQVGS